MTIDTKGCALVALLLCLPGGLLGLILKACGVAGWKVVATLTFGPLAIVVAYTAIVAVSAAWSRRSF